MGNMIKESEMKGEEVIRHTVWRQNAPLHDTWSLESARTKCGLKKGDSPLRSVHCRTLGSGNGTEGGRENANESTPDPRE